MHSNASCPVSGHIHLREGKRGAVWYAKYRGPARDLDGRIVVKQTEKKIGPATSNTSRPSPGTYTRKTAQAWLDEIEREVPEE